MTAIPRAKRILGGAGHDFYILRTQYMIWVGNTLVKYIFIRFIHFGTDIGFKVDACSINCISTL